MSTKDSMASQTPNEPTAPGLGLVHQHLAACGHPHSLRLGGLHDELVAGLGGYREVAVVAHHCRPAGPSTAAPTAD